MYYTSELTGEGYRKAFFRYQGYNDPNNSELEYGELKQCQGGQTKALCVHV